MKTRMLIPLAVLALAAVPAAQAKPAAKAAKQATFKATIKGSQVLTWTYDKLATGACDGNTHAGGSVETRFNSREGAKLLAVAVGKRRPVFASPVKIENGRAVVNPFRALATAEVEGTTASSGPALPSQCEDNGGGVIPPASDCGIRSSYLDIELSSVNRNKLLVGGKAHGWNLAARPNDYTGPALNFAFENCPFWTGGPGISRVTEGSLMRLAEALSEKALFDPKRKRIVVHGGDVNCFEAAGRTLCGEEKGEFRGKTITAWTLTLRRTK